MDKGSAFSDKMASVRAPFNGKPEPSSTGARMPLPGEIGARRPSSARQSSATLGLRRGLASASALLRRRLEVRLGDFDGLLRSLLCRLDRVVRRRDL
jgi:hypothetical protein